MSAPLIMIIRHGEKPTPEFDGVDEAGKHSDDNLIVRGWQRAGALVHRFAPLDGSPVDGRLARPTHVIAMCPDQRAEGEKDKSRREIQTAGPVVEALGLQLDRRFGKGNESKAALAAMGQDGPVLVVWDHNKIIELTKEITDSAQVPAEWPGERFDVIFILKRRPGGKGYDFEQMPQCLLPGDLSTVFPV